MARSFEGPSPPELPPPTPREMRSAANLKEHIARIAGTIGERNVWAYEALDATRSYLAGELSSAGYHVSEKAFEADGRSVVNLEAQRVGIQRPGEIIVIGAHYDSVTDSPGANDNATGVAAVLELSRLLRNDRPARTVRFVFFVNEEPPFFKSSSMGSRVYAERAARNHENIVAMFSLETIGYFSDVPGSQRYPFPLGLMYPDTGNFIGFVSNLASQTLLRKALRSFRAATPFPVEGVAAPALIPGIDWSDHWSFWRQGYPALMVTDTALYRYPFYHSPMDTPDKVDPISMARVVTGLAGVVRELAGQPG